MPNDPVVGGVTLRRPAISSPNFQTGVQGWTVNADGSAEFNSLALRGTFTGVNFVLNSSGLFFYSGIPALGNLIQSVTNGTGTDATGNAYLTETTVYEQVGGTFFATSLQAGAVAWFTAPAAGGPYTQQTDIGFSFDNVNGGSLLLQAANQVSFGNSGNALWSELNQQFDLPAGGGPFITGEGFHDISNGVGGVVARVKKLPWNAVWLDVEATEGATGTFNLATLPASSYNPVRDRRFTLGASAGTNARVFVPASPAAAVQLIVGGSGAWSGGASVMYPTN